LALLLSACAAVPDLGPKPLVRAPDSIEAQQSLQAASAVWPSEGWWKAYGDPQLDALIEEGLKASPDVAAAAARFRQASAVAQQAGAPLLPSVDLDAKGGVTKSSYNMGMPKEFVPKGWLGTGQVALNFGFDLDLWGKNRAALAAATSDAQAADIDARQARLALATGVADAYADLAKLHDEREIQARALEIRTASQKLVADRRANGLETRGSERQADATVASARAQLAAADQAIAIRQHQIAALIGVQSLGYSTAFNNSTGAIAGGSGSFLDTLFKKDSLFGNAGPAISLPIFHGGAISGQYRGARAAYDEAVASYDKTVLGAYQQVADAVTGRRSLDQRLADARAALTASEEAYSIARQRYEGGLNTYLDVLNVEDQLLAARQSVAELEASGFTLDIALIRALGGGFAVSGATPKELPHG